MNQSVTIELDDGELWRQASQGDPAAFGELFERHVNAVYTHCFRRTGSWEAAEDLASVVFLEAWRRRREVTLSGESILPWLLAVANNVVRNRDRSLRRHRRLLAKLPTSVVAPDPADDAVAKVDDERAMQRVLRVFSRLLPDEQDVLALCVWAGLSYADAAVALGVPIGTVRSRLSRARAHLRRLAGLGESDLDDNPNTRATVAASGSSRDTRRGLGSKQDRARPGGNTERRGSGAEPGPDGREVGDRRQAIRDDEAAGRRRPELSPRPDGPVANPATAQASESEGPDDRPAPRPVREQSSRRPLDPAGNEPNPPRRSNPSVGDWAITPAVTTGFTVGFSAECAGGVAEGFGGMALSGDLPGIGGWLPASRNTGRRFW